MVTTDVKTEFDRLVKEWYGRTSHHSNMSIVFGHPAYQKLLDMGPEIIPLIFKEIKKGRGRWYDALYHLTGKNPVPEGEFRSTEIEKHWLDWGRAKGFTI